MSVFPSAKKVKFNKAVQFTLTKEFGELLVSKANKNEMSISGFCRNIIKKYLDDVEDKGHSNWEAHEAEEHKVQLHDFPVEVLLSETYYPKLKKLVTDNNEILAKYSRNIIMGYLYSEEKRG